MTFKNKLAVGFAVLTMGGTALASDASADRAAALEARGTGTEVRQIVAKKTAAVDAAAEHPCDRKDCCAMSAPAPAPAPAAAPSAAAPSFTDFG